MRAVLLTGHGGRIGADAVVRRDAMDLAAEVKEAADGRPVDVVADVVGGPAFAELLNVLRPMVRYVAAGAIAGPVVSLDLRTLYLKQLELIGSTMGTHEEFAELVNHMSSGQLEPLLAKTYPYRRSVRPTRISRPSRSLASSR